MLENVSCLFMDNGSLFHIVVVFNCVSPKRMLSFSHVMSFIDNIDVLPHLCRLFQCCSQGVVVSKCFCRFHYFVVFNLSYTEFIVVSTLAVVRLLCSSMFLWFFKVTIFFSRDCLMKQTGQPVKSQSFL